MEQLIPEELARKRRLGADRVRRWRHAKKDAAETALAAEWSAKDRREIRDKLWFFGESEPRIDASTFLEELQIHMEWLRAMGRPGPQPGETLRDIARRTWNAWGEMEGASKHPMCGCRGYRHGFDRNKQVFNFQEGFVVDDVVNFDDTWREPLDDRPIDVANLPPLPEEPWPIKELRARKNLPYERKKFENVPVSEIVPGPKPQPKPQPAAVVPSAPTLSEQLRESIANWQGMDEIPPDARRFINGG